MKLRTLTEHFRKVAGITAISASVVLLSGATTVNPLVVKLNTAGSVEGKWNGNVANTAREFLGIPYAKAPVGKLRFMPPLPTTWAGTKSAKAFGASCMQNPGALAATGTLSEDCLSLNVFTPPVSSSKTAQKLPVMVWIHGGAFIAGGSNQYPGHKLAQDKNVIVVTMNYRLGALGFLSHPAVDTALGGPYSGNMGLHDQQLALMWVKANINKFGGDPTNITLMGESAGAMSVCTHMVAPGSQYLVDRFILQSGVCVGGLPVFTKATVEGVSTQLSNELCANSADTLACLRSLPAASITSWGASRGIFGAGWGATVIPNSLVLPDTPKNLISAGQYNKGELMLGTNKYEWSLFQMIGAAPSVTSIAQFNGYLDASYPAPMAAALKAAYAPPVDALANVYLSTLMTDQVFRCPTRRMANLVQANGSDVWLYSFEQNNPAHAFEIPYLFNYVSAPLGIDPTNSPTKDVMQNYWSSFAVDGNPNGGTMPNWPSYDGAAQEYMVLKDVPVSGVGLSAAACNLWDSFGI